MKYRSKISLMILLAVCGLGLSFSRSNAQTVMGCSAGPENTKPFLDALHDHRPVLKFDSGEKFFPVNARAITDHNGNRLVRENGDLIRERIDNRGLTIRYLRHGDDNYPTSDVNGDKDVRASDRINALGTKPGDFVGDDSTFQNVVYKRICYLRNGSQLKGAWLQYWFFYYYNDYPGLDKGDHEGDWEMVQILVDAEVKPVLAVYSRHGSGLWAEWEKGVEPIGSRKVRPIVYVALGSHANYFHTGPCRQDINNDGDGPALRKYRSIRLGSPSTKLWLEWPGKWGGSDKSPNGPRFQKNRDMWDDPTAFYRSVLLNDCSLIF